MVFEILNASICKCTYNKYKILYSYHSTIEKFSIVVREYTPNSQKSCNKIDNQLQYVFDTITKNETNFYHTEVEIIVHKFIYYAH